MESSLSISFSISSDQSDYVLIDQEEWKKDVGRTSVSQGALAIGSMVFGGGLPDANCGGLGGFDVTVFAYPSRPGLSFHFLVSHGNILSRVREIVTREEIVQCSLQDSAKLDYPPSGSVSKNWIGECYNEHGGIIIKPSVDIIGRDIYFSEKVYGSLRVRYSVTRVKYFINIQKRDYSIENNFDSIAYAVWDGGVVYEDIKAPSGYDITEGNCGNGSLGDTGQHTTIVIPPDECSYPEVLRADKQTNVEFCSQEILSEKITETSSPDPERCK